MKNRTVFGSLLCLLVLPAFAQLHPQAMQRRAVVDPANVLDDRGAKLEIYPARRALPKLNATTHTVVHQVVRANATDGIGPKHLGVVFNHAMQQQGYITGEIAFRMKAGQSPVGFSPALYPGLKKIVASGVYVANARTLSEFMAVVKRLQRNPTVDWVEPAVQYGPSAAEL